MPRLPTVLEPVGVQRLKTWRLRQADGTIERLHGCRISLADCCLRFVARLSKFLAPLPMCAYEKLFGADRGGTIVGATRRNI